MQRARERYRVLHRQPRAGTDREVRGVGGVAYQHVLAMVPTRVAQMREPAPDRIVGHKVLAVERVGEDLFAQRTTVRLFHALEAGTRKGRLINLDDERAAARRVAIMMRVEIANRRVAESLCQRVENLGRAKPGEPVGAIT